VFNDNAHSVAYAKHRLRCAKHRTDKNQLLMNVLLQWRRTFYVRPRIFCDNCDTTCVVIVEHYHGTF